MRVLLVEDYAPLRGSVAQALEEAGFAVDASADGEEGLWYARSGDYDAIVLDIVLPKLDGLSVLKQLRQSGDQTPVLLLTAKDTVADRVRGLDLGADDYLIKPFALEELLARVRALLRRKYDAADPIIRIRDLEVNTVSRIVRRAGEPINLTAREAARPTRGPLVILGAVLFGLLTHESHAPTSYAVPVAAMPG